MNRTYVPYTGQGCWRNSCKPPSSLPRLMSNQVQLSGWATPDWLLSKHRPPTLHHPSATGSQWMEVCFPCSLVRLWLCGAPPTCSGMGVHGSYLGWGAQGSVPGRIEVGGGGVGLINCQGRYASSTTLIPGRGHQGPESPSPVSVPSKPQDLCTGTVPGRFQRISSNPPRASGEFSAEASSPHSHGAPVSGEGGKAAMSL